MTLRALLFVIKTELHVELTSVPATLIQKGEIENIFTFHLFSHQHTHTHARTVCVCIGQTLSISPASFRMV